MLVIVDKLIKRVNYKSIKTIIHAIKQVEINVDMIVRQNSVLNYILTNKNTLFILKF